MSTEPCSHHAHTLPAKERTLNGTGHMFNTRSIAAEYWLGSLPMSSRPLLDIGACYGVHTLLALSKGRDVIALDSAAGHLSELLRRVEQQVQRYNEQGIQNKLGTLVGCVEARLPDRNAIPRGSVSGVLVSEVMHFLQPGEPLQILNDAYEWLCDGGLLAVSTGSMSGSNLNIAPDMVMFHKGRTKEEVRKLIEEKSGEEIIQECPGLITYPKIAEFGDRHIQFYMLTTIELETMARLAGFKVLECKYCSQGKYVLPFAKDVNLVKDESVLLIAEK